MIEIKKAFKESLDHYLDKYDLTDSKFIIEFKKVSNYPRPRAERIDVP